MLNNHKCIIDTHCEVYDLLKPWADGIFWDFKNHEVVENAIYMIGREQFRLNVTRIKNIALQNYAKIILSNPAEGSETILGQILRYGIEDLVKEKKILILGGGDLDPLYPCLKYESFMVKMLNYNENIYAAKNNQEIYTKKNKPYKFLFLNGRNRWHRKTLIKQLKEKEILNSALWTCLESTMGQIKLLPKEYEVRQFQKQVNIEQKEGFIKHNLFKGVWGDVYLHLPAYIDTYFSLVTETVFNYPYSFRTEKIWKPIVIGHPWIAVANRGFYKDLKNMGFKTFSHLLDESFDDFDNDVDRLNRISEIVGNLCHSNLNEFILAASDTCKYNQLHFEELRKQEIASFSNRFVSFIKNTWPNE